MSKRFFYACAGLLCLVAAYQLGAVGASASSNQGAVLVEVIESRTASPSYLAIDSAGRLFGFDEGLGWSVLAQCPPGTPASMHIGTYFNSYVIGMESGDVFTFPIPVGEPPIEFTPVGNVFDGPTPVESSSWGRTKGSHRN